MHYIHVVFKKKNYLSERLFVFHLFLKFSEGDCLKNSSDVFILEIMGEKDI